MEKYIWNSKSPFNYKHIYKQSRFSTNICNHTLISINIAFSILHFKLQVKINTKVNKHKNCCNKI